MENGKLIINHKFGFEFCWRRGVAAVCACLMLAMVAAAQIEEPPKPAAPGVVIVPKPIERTLPNGLRVIVVERKNVPLVTAQIMIRSGSAFDQENLAGTADMTAELLTKGTRTRTATEIAEQIEFLGGQINSNADFDFSTVTFRATSNKLDQAMRIQADAIRNPAFAQTEIDRYKTQLLDELNVSLKQPGALADYATNLIVFQNHPYAHLPSGTPESIKRLTRVDLLRFHREHYKADNAILIVAGDVAPAAVFAAARKHFGTWAKSPPRKRFDVLKDPVEIAQTIGKQALKSFVKADRITLIDLPNSGQAAVAIGQRGISRDAPNFYQGLVANSVLGGGYSARLNQEIRIKRGLSYGARSDLAARAAGGIFSLRTQTKNESAAEVAEIMIGELNRLTDQPIVETELTPRKAVLIGDFARDLETTNGLVQQIGELAVYDLELAEINRFIQNVQNVKDAEARRFVVGLFGDSGAQIVIVGDAKLILPDLQKRFSNVPANVVPIGELDLNNRNLRKTAKPNARKIGLTK